MGNIAVGGEYFPISWDHWITKVLIKEANTLDKDYVSDVIDGCDV